MNPLTPFLLFNVTLEVRERPNSKGGRDPDSEDFWARKSEVAIVELGLTDCTYTWRSTIGRHMVSRIDWFLF